MATCQALSGIRHGFDGVATGCNGLQHLEIAQAVSEAQRQQHRA